MSVHEYFDRFLGHHYLRDAVLHWGEKLCQFAGVEDQMPFSSLITPEPLKLGRVASKAALYPVSLGSHVLREVGVPVKEGAALRAWQRSVSRHTATPYVRALDIAIDLARNAGARPSHVVEAFPVTFQADVVKAKLREFDLAASGNPRAYRPEIVLESVAARQRQGFAPRSK